jgi:hypothetical protein
MRGPVLELFPCLKRDVAAGKYAIAIESAELTDFSTDRAIPLPHSDATLFVHERVNSTAECSPPKVDPEAWGRPAPRSPWTSFEIGSGVVTEGKEIDLPFVIDSNGDVRAIAFSIDFDEERIQLEEIVETLELPDDAFRFFEFNNENSTPGNGGVDEGFLVGAVILNSSEDTRLANEIVRFYFEIASRNRSLQRRSDSSMELQDLGQSFGMRRLSPGGALGYRRIP